MQTKPLPHNEQIEQIILGTYFAYPETQKTIGNRVKPDDFYIKKHAEIQRLIYIHKELNNDSDVTSYISFMNFLESKGNGTITSIGGHDYLIGLISQIMTKAGIDNIIATFKDLSERRKIITQCHSIIRSCYDEYGIDIGDIIKDMKIVFESEKPRNLTTEIKAWVDESYGYFSVTMCDKELEIVTKRDKANRRKVFSRLCNDGIVEKNEKISGSYRRVEETIFEDWQHATAKPINFRLPFGMEKYVETYNGDVILFAGVKSSGKTGMAIETMKLNMRNLNTFYHSSELRKETFKMRLSKSKDVKIDDWPVKFSSGLTLHNAPDRVQPDGFNVFDYLESDTGEDYAIPGTIARIHRKLKSGIALICLQKNATKDFGVGGEQTRAKPNLYCTLSKGRPNKLKILECKAFGEENPNGFVIDYKIVNGITLIPQGTLMPEI